MRPALAVFSLGQGPTSSPLHPGAQSCPRARGISHAAGKRRERLREGIKAVSRVIILGVVMDVIYQIVVLHGFRPLQLAVIVLGLAFLPYLILRGPIARLARHFLQRKADAHETHLAPNR
jgi:Flp pilus assembly protein TadB